MAIRTGMIAPVLVVASILSASVFADPQPIPHAAYSPDKEEVKEIVREEKLSKLMHQRAREISSGVERDLQNLQRRMQEELVDKDFNGGDCVSSGCPPSRSERSEKYTPEAFNEWWQDQQGWLRRWREEEEGANGTWSEFNREARYNWPETSALGPDGQMHTLSHAQALAEKWKRIHIAEAGMEAAEYVDVKYQILCLWVLYVNEVIGGEGLVHGRHRAPGLADLVVTSFCRDERDVSYQHALVECEMARESLAPRPNYAKFGNETQRCQGAEGPIWDRAAIALRPLRDRLYTERDQIHRQLMQWRDFCISNHIYPGEGPAAIYAVYRDEKDLSVSVLDSTVLGPGQDAVLLLGLVHVSTERRVVAALPVPVCDSPEHPTRAVTIADIEIEPYRLAVYRGNQARVSEGTASGADTEEDP